MDEKLQAILQQTYQMYIKYGIKSVSMDDIASACGISKKTLYENVKDKRHLVELVITELVDKGTIKPHGVCQENLSALDVLFWAYRSVLTMVKDYNVAFDYDLQKYYPDLYQIFRKRIREIKYEKMYQNLLQGHSAIKH